MSLKSFLLSVTAAAAGILLLSSASWAVPGGSYLESCTSVRQSGTFVSAACREANGNFRNTSFDMQKCGAHTSKLTNHNGRLRCEGGLPRGSYSRSCQEAFIEDEILRAICLNRNQQPISTSIRLP